MKKDLIKKIKQLKEEKNAVILAHNYQIGEIQDIADYTGDSLGLSREAANVEEDVIVFCGVDFMAETAAILSPEKTVLLPVNSAECPMAEMVTVDGLREKKEQHPAAAVVCYVNSSAAIKAESDVCCTSSNAVRVVESIPQEEVIFVPDKNLADYVEKQTDKKIIKWEGLCPTHHRVKGTDIKKVREVLPDAPIIVHPECRPEVVAGADFVGSTAQILEFASETSSQTIIIGTEEGIIHRLKKENPGKEFYVLNKGLICQNMKLTSLEDVAWALENMRNQVTVQDSVRLKAQEALDQMLKLG